MAEKTERDVVEEKIKSAAARLAEQCDLESVQILATKHMPDGITQSFDYTVGNMFAAYGKALLWCKMSDSALNSMSSVYFSDNEDQDEPEQF